MSESLLTAAQFKAIIALTKVREGARREAARLVLCEGYANSEAAARVGCTRQHVHGVLVILKRAFELAKIATSSG